jgi:hypothetical protein
MEHDTSDFPAAKGSIKKKRCEGRWEKGNRGLQQSRVLSGTDNFDIVAVVKKLLELAARKNLYDAVHFRDDVVAPEQSLSIR